MTMSRKQQMKIQARRRQGRLKREGVYNWYHQRSTLQAIHPPPPKLPLETAAPTKTSEPVIVSRKVSPPPNPHVVRPIDHIVMGQRKALAAIYEWLTQFMKGQTRTIALLYGKCGVGKSLAAEHIAKTNQFTPVVINCSSERVYTDLYPYLLQTCLGHSFGQRTMLILEEIDGICASGVRALVSFLQTYTTYNTPIMATCNESHGLILKPLMKFCTRIIFYRLSDRDMLHIARRHCSAPRTILRQFVDTAHGDGRQLKLLCDQYCPSMADQHLSIFDIVKRLYVNNKLSPHEHHRLQEQLPLAINILFENTITHCHDTDTMSQCADLFAEQDQYSFPNYRDISHIPMPEYASAMLQHGIPVLSTTHDNNTPLTMSSIKTTKTPRKPWLTLETMITGHGA